MNFFRNHIFTRILCCLMAFQVFNISVDMPDRQPENVPEDLSINEMESVVEIVLEECLHIDNAISEHDETGHEPENMNLEKVFSVYLTHSPEMAIYNLPVSGTGMIPYHESFWFDFCREINPPPPKHA